MPTAPAGRPRTTYVTSMVRELIMRGEFLNLGPAL
jgi:hypothetical protein